MTRPCTIRSTKRFEIEFRALLTDGAQEEVRFERVAVALPNTTGLPRSRLVSNPMNKEGPESSSGALALPMPYNDSLGPPEGWEPEGLRLAR